MYVHALASDETNKFKFKLKLLFKDFKTIILKYFFKEWMSIGRIHHIDYQ